MFNVYTRPTNIGASWRIFAREVKKPTCREACQTVVAKNESLYDCGGFRKGTPDKPFYTRASEVCAVNTNRRQP